MTGERPSDGPWHARTADQVLRDLDSNSAGLGDDEARRRRLTHGDNVLPRPRPPGLLVIFLRQFRSPLIYLLLAAAAVSLAIGEITDAIFIFAVLNINAVIGTVQSWKAETHAHSLDSLIRIWAVVVRGGEARRLDAVELVPGDIIRVESGDKVPADMRLLRDSELQVDESLLTGESMPVVKHAEAILPEDTGLGDRRNMLHAGTTVVVGRGTGVVTDTGTNTGIGHIAEALAHATAEPAPLVKRLDLFTRRVGLMVVVAVTALGLIQALQGLAPHDIFMVSVALAVSAIPEGLPVAITVALAVATARMARRNVIVRALPAVEGLGACTVLASDKTGTLTQNQMTVTRLWLPAHGHLRVGGVGYGALGDLTDGDGAPLRHEVGLAARQLALSGALCNEATLRLDTDGRVLHFGDTVDVAFLDLARKAGLEQANAQRENQLRFMLGFEPSRRYAAAVTGSGTPFRIHVKGGAEAVISMCAEVDRSYLLEAARVMASEGYRVLAVADGTVDQPELDMDGAPPDSLRFLGLVGLIDPLRPESLAAVQDCQRAGVQVRMITGDHPETALAIARDLGIADQRQHVVTGPELRQLTAAQAHTRLAEARVYARVEPEQKLAIVHSLAQRGDFVAMTGDGVNDAPALRAANIGVAMGRGGTDVARGAADLILADDNFASIVAGIEEGRIAYNNVRKVVYLLISTGAAEILLFALALLFGLPLPLFAVQLLWLNLVTNGIQDVALGFERGETKLLNRPPRPPDQPIFDRRMIEQSVLSGGFIGMVGFGFFAWALNAGYTEDQARNMLLMLMVLFENVHVFNCRSETQSAFRVPLHGNPFLIIAVICAQGIHVGAAYVPGLGSVLGVAPIGGETWIGLFVLTTGLVFLMEGYKILRRH